MEAPGSGLGGIPAQVPKVRRLASGAKGIRTPGPTVNGADTEGRPTPTIAPSPESAAYRSGISLRQHVGPGVRIHFAPAVSQANFVRRAENPGLSCRGTRSLNPSPSRGELHSGRENTGALRNSATLAGCRQHRIRFHQSGAIDLCRSSGRGSDEPPVPAIHPARREFRRCALRLQETRSPGKPRQ
jgi:hypothetical protein